MSEPLLGRSRGRSARAAPLPTCWAVLLCSAKRDVPTRRRARSLIHASGTPFPTPRTLPATPRPIPAMQPPIPAAPLPPAQPQPVLWYELPDHYRSRMRNWYGPQLPGPPWTPAGDRPFPYPVVPLRDRRGINEHERDIHYQIRIEAYYRQPFTRESLFRDQPRVPPPATAHSPPVSTWGQPPAPAWGEPSVPARDQRRLEGIHSG